MKSISIYQTLRRGFKSRDFCEDFVLTFPLLEGRLVLGVVSDGCSSGISAHFPSALQCKLIRKIAKSQALTYRDLEDTEAFSLLILQEFMQELHRTFSLLDLPKLEGLATLMLLIYDQQTEMATVQSLGDGVIIFDTEVIEIEQDNRPKYPAYLLDKPNEWQVYLTEHVFTRQNCSNLAVSSDGITSFMNRQNPIAEVPLDATDYLLIDENLHKSTHMLSRKCNILETQHYLENYDDLGIVRFLIY